MVLNSLRADNLFRFLYVVISFIQHGIITLYVYVCYKCICIIFSESAFQAFPIIPIFYPKF